MPKVIVYVPAAAWRALEARGLDPAKAVREFARQGYETSGEPIIRRDDGRLQPLSEAQAEINSGEAEADTSSAVPSAVLGARVPSPGSCGMSNRHHLRSAQDPCPRCGYPTV